MCVSLSPNRLLRFPFCCRDQRLFAALLRASLTFPESSLLVPRPKVVCCPSPCVAHFPQIEPSCAETRGCLLPFFVRRSLSPNLFCCEVLNADEIRQIQGCLSTQAFLWFVFRPPSAFNSPFWTTISGAPVYNNNSSLTVGPRGVHIILGVPRSRSFMVVVSQMMEFVIMNY
ncbi:Uncharacterized protein TCM_010721 [Theobroma cacao]|uniref:Uncharacterized protein n=1 Tax=Theobroma cacao TaxID=3641 RepID=A0A061E8W0_THECC|nr:Uncharacterized protein TCM_010721 [Theobroma cacao]